MDQLDENLRELKRRVDARVEQILIVRQAQSSETQALANSHKGLLVRLEDNVDLDYSAHTRPAFLLPQGDDPTVVHADVKPSQPNPNPTAGFDQLPERATMLTVAERAAGDLLEKTASSSTEHYATSTISQVRILAHPPAIRHQSFLYRFFGRFLNRKD